MDQLVYIICTVQIILYLHPPACGFFYVVSFAIKLRRLTVQVSPSSVLVPGVLYIDTSVLGPFGVAFIACLRLLSGFMIPFQSA